MSNIFDRYEIEEEVGGATPSGNVFERYEVEEEPSTWDRVKDNVGTALKTGGQPALILANTVVDAGQENPDGIIGAVSRGLRKIAPSLGSAAASTGEALVRNMASAPSPLDVVPAFKAYKEEQRKNSKIAGMMDGAADLLGDAARSLDKTRQKIDSEKPEELQRRLWGNPDLLLDPRWWTETGIDTASSLIPTVVAGIYGGPAAAGVVGGSQEGSALYRELVDEGVDEEKARVASLAYGTVSGLLNAIGAETILGKKGLESLAGKGVLKRLARRGFSGTVEGLSEYAEEPAQAAAQAIAEGKGMEEVVGSVVESLKNVDVIPTSMLMGGAMHTDSAYGTATEDVDLLEETSDQKDTVYQHQDQDIQAERAELARLHKKLRVGEELTEEEVARLHEVQGSEDVPMGEPEPVPTQDLGPALEAPSVRPGLEAGPEQLALPEPTQINMPGSIQLGGPNTVDLQNPADEVQAGQEPAAGVPIQTDPIAQLEKQPAVQEVAAAKKSLAGIFSLIQDAKAEGWSFTQFTKQLRANPMEHGFITAKGKTDQLAITAALKKAGAGSLRELFDAPADTTPAAAEVIPQDGATEPVAETEAEIAEPAAEPEPEDERWEDQRSEAREFIDTEEKQQETQEKLLEYKKLATDEEWDSALINGSDTATEMGFEPGSDDFIEAAAYYTRATLESEYEIDSRKKQDEFDTPQLKKAAESVAEEAEAAGLDEFGKMIRSGIKLGGVRQANIDFWQGKLGDLKAQAGKADGPVAEVRGLKEHILNGQPVEQADSYGKTFIEYASREEGDQDLISQADKAYREGLAAINDAGYKIHDVNSAAPARLSKIKKATSGLGGAVSRFVGKHTAEIKGYKRGSAEQTAAAKKLVLESIKELNSLLGESSSEAAPAAEQVVTKPKRNKEEARWEFEIDGEKYYTFRNPAGAGLSGWHLGRASVVDSHPNSYMATATKDTGFVYVAENRDEAIEEAKRWERERAVKESADLPSVGPATKPSGQKGQASPAPDLSQLQSELKEAKWAVQNAETLAERKDAGLEVKRLQGEIENTKGVDRPAGKAELDEWANKAGGEGGWIRQRVAETGKDPSPQEVAEKFDMHPGRAAKLVEVNGINGLKYLSELGNTAPMEQLRARHEEIVEAPRLSVAEETAAEPDAEQKAPRKKDRPLIAKLKERLNRDLPGREELVDDVHEVEAPNETVGNVAAAIKKLFGIDVVFLKGMTEVGATGIYLRGLARNTIFVNTGDGFSVRRVIGHELLHALEVRNPVMYRQFKGVMLGFMKNTGRYQRQLNELRGKRGLGEQNYAHAMDELLADFVGDQLLDPSFWNQLAEYAPKKKDVVRYVATQFHDAISKIVGYLKGKTKTSAFVKDLEVARDIAAQYLGLMTEQESDTQQGVDESAEAKLRVREGDFDGIKITKAGKVVGAPQWLNTKGQIAGLKRTVAKLAKEGLAFKDWYEKSGRAVRERYPNPEDARKFLQIIAVYSATRDVKGNLDLAVKAMEQWKGGVPREEFYVAGASWDPKAIDILYDGNETWEGQKTSTFFSNLMAEVDPAFHPDVFQHGATIDRWMARAFGYGKDSVSDAQYRFAEEIVRMVGEDLDIPAHQAQAAIWIATKARWQKGKRNYRGSEVKVQDYVRLEGLRQGWIKRTERRSSNGQLFVNFPTVTEHMDKVGRLRMRGILDTQVTQDDLQSSGFDYADGLNALPVSGGSIEVAPNPREAASKPLTEAFSSLNYDKKLAVTRSVGYPVIKDVFNRFGLKLGRDFSLNTVPGGFDGEVNPSIEVRVHNKAVDFGDVTDATYAAGYVLRQNSIVLFDEKDQKNSQTYFVRVEPDQKLNDQEIADVYQKVTGAFPGAEGFSTRDGSLLFGNFTHFSDNPLSDEGFFAGIESALADDERVFHLDSKTFRSELIETERLPNGDRESNAQQQEELSWWGDGQLDSARAEAQEALREALREAGAKFSLAARVDERADGAGQQDPERGSAGTVWDGVETGEDGRVALVHHSNTPDLGELDPAKYGTAMAGAERKRQQNSPDNFLPRTYLGVTTGPAPYQKEPGLGPHQYVVKENPSAIYHAQEDPDGLAAKSVDFGRFDFTVYEKNIREAGYRGYYMNDPQLGGVVALFEKADPESYEGDAKFSLAEVGRSRAKVYLPTEQMVAELQQAYGHSGKYDQSRAGIVMMNPRTFLSLATDGGQEVVGRAKGYGKFDADLMDQQAGNVPTLYVEPDGKIWGHEGRARNTMAKDSSIRRMPVVLFNRKGYFSQAGLDQISNLTEENSQRYDRTGQRVIDKPILVDPDVASSEIVEKLRAQAGESTDYDNGRFERGEYGKKDARFSLSDKEATEAFENLGFRVDDQGQVTNTQGKQIGKLSEMSPWRRWQTLVMAKVINPLDGIIDGTGHLPQRKRYQQRRWDALGQLDALEGEARKIFDTLRKATPEQAKEIYKYLTTKDAAESMLPAEYLDFAVQVKEQIMENGRQLVARGMMSEAVLETREGEYLPRVYLKFLLGEDAANTLVAGSGKGLNLKYLKRRKDIPANVRKFVLGEVEDPAFLASRAHGIQARDMAMHDFMSDIASNKNWVLPRTIVDWSHDERAWRKHGNVRYRENTDGTYDVVVTERKTKEVKLDNVKPSQLLQMVDTEVGNKILANKGKPVVVSSKGKHSISPWRDLGNGVKWRLNKDGSYNVRIKQKTTTERRLRSATAATLADSLSGFQASVITEGKGRLIGGQMVTPLHMIKEAQRMDSMAESMAEEDADETRRLAGRMRAEALRVIEAIKTEHGLDLEDPNSLPKDWKQIPNTKRYGTLRGAVVRREIYDDLVGNVSFAMGERGWVEELFMEGGKLSKFHSLWKWKNTALNITAQARNWVSNTMLIHMSGVPMARLPDLYVKAIQEIVASHKGAPADQHKHWAVAKKYGINKASFSATEMGRIETEFLDTIGRTSDESAQRYAIRKLHLIFSKLYNASGDVYQFGEAVGKTVIIMHGMEKGMSESEAAEKAHKWLFDYSLANRNIKALRSNILGSPFLTFTAKVLPRIMEVAATAPWRLLPYAAATYGLQAMVAEMFDVDDDDLDKLKKALPKWIAEKQHAYFLPVKDEAGRWQVVDLGYIFPWGGWTESVGAMARGDIKSALQPFSVGGPIPDLITAWNTGLDPFTQQPIVPVGADASEEVASLLKYAWNYLAPPFLTQHGPLRRGWQAVNGEVDMFGEAKTTSTQALLRWAGTNIYSYHPEISRAWNIRAAQAEMQEVVWQQKKKIADQNLTGPQRAKLVKETNDKLKRMKRELIEYVGESDIHENLKTME